MTGAAALSAAALVGTATAQAAPTVTTKAVASTGSSTTYAVLAAKGADANAVAAALTKAGAQVQSVNAAIGLVTVKSSDAGFLAKARATKGVSKAAVEGIVGKAPVVDANKKRDAVEKENRKSPGKSHGNAAADKKGKKGATDPLDHLLWGMDMIDAPEAHRLETGDKRVKVGVIDTGIDASHPDLRPNFDFKLSRNFTTDMPDIDGPCEVDGCKDPATVDEGGHGTHVAGTIGAALNGFGLSGVAPTIGLVNLRAGQDSGYFFLGPVSNAITYAADNGVDVVNMSFYVDPYAFYCTGGAPEDSAEEAAQQDLTIETMRRVMEYAHGKGVTMVGSAGNSHLDLANPGIDQESPNYPANTAHPRTINGQTCYDLPVEGPHTIGVTAVGPSGKKADYSNWTTDLKSGEVEVAAPGGWFRDGFGTDSYKTNENLILSTAPLKVLQEEGSVDENGNITELGEALGVMKQCRDKQFKGATSCGYYQYLQGTSMASPHASGVAALIVSAHGRVNGRAGYGLAPDTVKSILMKTATNHACPAGGVQSYTNEGRDASFTATCVGTPDFNGFYGDGIVNAFNAVR
ncbi:S8 family serine peptidase [Actinomycetota bacterium]